MFDKFDKYWKVIHIMLAVAVILDLMCKMKVVEFYFPKVYGNDATYEIEQVKRTFYDLPFEYQSRSCKPKSHSFNTLVKASPSIQALSQRKLLSKFVAFVSSSSSDGNVKSELDHYLNDALAPWVESVDILNWWRINGLKCPTLQMMAKDFLAVPISMIASELAFSTSKRVVSKHRSRLHPETSEALMCT
ncbi:HAT [Theobroma cacao]|nr:HAT [Theobroma cacao]